MLVDRATREAARNAFVAIGPPGLAFLRESLADASLLRPTRVHLPRSISRFAPEESAPILLDHLIGERDTTVRYKMLRGLGRLQAQVPELVLDRSILDQAIRRTLEEGLRLARWQRSLAGHSQPASELSRLLADVLADERARAIEELFRLLGLRHPGERFERIFRGLGGGRTAKASSRELVEHLVDPSLRVPILSLIEERVASTITGDSSQELEATLRSVAASSSRLKQELANAMLGERQPARS
jgi:hypothetical protein